MNNADLHCGFSLETLVYKFAFEIQIPSRARNFGVFPATFLCHIFSPHNTLSLWWSYFVSSCTSVLMVTMAQTGNES